MHASNENAMILGAEDGAFCIEYMLFKDCIFFNETEQAILTAFELTAAADATRQHILLVNCVRNTGIADYEDQARACVWVGGSMGDLGTASSMGFMTVATSG